MMFSSDDTLDFGFEILLNEIEILSYLHRLLFDVIECDEPEFEEKQSDLFLYLNNIPIETNFNVYEAFIQLLVHASLIRHYYQSVFQRIISILDELLRKHNLKEVFHPLTIFNVFEKNKVLLLHLYENNIIDLSLIMNEIWAYADESLFLYFGYEIIKESQSFFEETVDYLRIRKSKYQFYYNTDKQEEFFCGRKHGHSFDKLSKIIQNDDIDSFISIYFSLKNDSNESFDLNQKIYPPACESNKDIRNFNRGISLLEYSMAFGSVKIFKYLWIHKVEYSKASLIFCVIGGNYEIIRTIEDESQYSFDEKCLSKAFEYHQTDIAEYFMNNLNVIKTKEELFEQYLIYYNFEQMYVIFSDIFVQPKISKTNFFLESLLGTSKFISSDIFKIYMFGEILLKFPMFDINSKDQVMILNLLFI